ncbi:uncharacterized protein LOC134643027 isoform X1 [Pelmatolapia mariae]|uniref:uncharacterized protein LOC134643027 isoform X1 n=1 Tax=Pelmatolapia mariae TaxID=158779 RepID=UPI003211F841
MGREAFGKLKRQKQNSEISLVDSSLFDSLDQIDISDLDNYVFSRDVSDSPPVLERVTGKNIRLSTRERQALLSDRARPASSTLAGAPARPGKNLHLLSANPTRAPVGGSHPPRSVGKNLHLTARQRQELFAAHAPTPPAAASSPTSGHPQPQSLRSNRGPLTNRNRRTVRRTRRPASTRRTRQIRVRRDRLASVALRAVSLFAELVQLIL